MKRGDKAKLMQLDIKKLHATAEETRKEIALLKMYMKTKSQKDTNAEAKKKKELAVILTVIRQRSS